jgi:hypothetical protein
LEPKAHEINIAHTSCICDDSSENTSQQDSEKKAGENDAESRSTLLWSSKVAGEG